MRMRTKVNVTVTADTEGKDKLFALDDAKAETVLDGMQEISSGTCAVAVDTTFEVPFGAISDARGVFLKATQGFRLSINGGAEIEVKKGAVAAGSPSPTFADSAKVFLEAGLTDVSVRVPTGGTALTLTYLVWGDPISGG